MSTRAHTEEEKLRPSLAWTRPAGSGGMARGRRLTEVRLVADEPLDFDWLADEFPTVSMVQVGAIGPGELAIDDFAWRGAFDLSRFDEAVQAAPDEPLVIRGDDAVGVAGEALSRYQRWIARRNSASATRTFEAVLEAHAALVSQPPFAAEDVSHMLDTWQWLLRLDPTASLRSQVAALVHEIDRLADDPKERLEHHARSDANGAARSGVRAVALLRGAGLSHADAEGVRDVLSLHPDHDREALLIEDADALSFLSLSSARYADHFGLAQTRRKIGFTVGRLGDLARRKLTQIRLRPDVARLVHGVAA
jgi:hypothetical protein